MKHYTADISHQYAVVSICKQYFTVIYNILGNVGGAVVSGSEKEIGDTSSNSSRVQYNHFLTITLEKGMNPYPIMGSPAICSIEIRRSSLLVSGNLAETNLNSKTFLP